MLRNKTMTMTVMSRLLWMKIEVDANSVPVVRVWWSEVLPAVVMGRIVVMMRLMKMNLDWRGEQVVEGPEDMHESIQPLEAGQGVSVRSRVRLVGGRLEQVGKGVREEGMDVMKMMKTIWVGGLLYELKAILDSETVQIACMPGINEQ